MRWAAWAAVGVALAGPAAAGDGSWTQIDGWPSGVQWVTNIERGNWMLGTASGVKDDEVWARLSLLRRWSVGPDSAPVNLRAGIALRAQQIQWYEADDTPASYCVDAAGGTCVAFAAGLRLSVDQWKQSGDWGRFLMAEWTSTENQTMAVAGLTYLPWGLGAQLSLWHEDGGDVLPTIMISKSITPRLSIRVGHKFIEDDSFIGLSLSTY